MTDRTLDDSFAQFVLAICNARPRPLKVVNSRAALEERAVNAEQILQATAQYLDALMADTGQHFNIRPDQLDTGILADVASDIRGKLVDAIRNVVHAA